MCPCACQRVTLLHQSTLGVAVAQWVEQLATDWWFDSLSLQLTSLSVPEQDTEPQFTPSAASLMCECRHE